MKKIALILLALMLCLSAALAETTGMADPRFDAGMADYNGVWQAVCIDMAGMRFEVSELGMAIAMSLTVDNGFALMVEGYGGEAMETHFIAAVENGALILTAEEIPGDVRMQLLTDGTMVYAVEEESMTICFEKISSRP